MRNVTILLALLFIIGLTLVQVGCSSKEDPAEPQPEPCSIKITTPAGGGEYATGDDVSLRWAKTGSVSKVKIELVKGSLASTIKASHDANTSIDPDNGFYSWEAQTYGQATGDNYSLRVTAVGEETCTDQTNNFRIVNLANCNFEFPYGIQNPIKDMRAGNEFPIEWTSTETSGFVRLELWSTSFAPNYTPHEPFWVMAEDLPDTGGYLWTVTSFNFSDNAVYRWRIFDSMAGDCTQTSYFFRLLDNEVCAIDVGGIGTDQKLTPGEPVDLLIGFTNGAGLVDVDLYAGVNRVPGADIATAFDPASGPLRWIVTDLGYTGPDNSKYYVHVESRDDPYCSGLSQRFTITR